MWCAQRTRRELGFQNTCTVEHVIPVSKGGDNSVTNLGSACFRCNQERGTQSAEMFVICAAQFEPDCRLQVEAVNAKLNHIRKQILSGEIPRPPAPPSKLREREHKQAARQAYVTNPHFNPFEPHSRPWRMFASLVQKGGDWWTAKHMPVAPTVTVTRAVWHHRVLTWIQDWCNRFKLTTRRINS